MKYEFKYEKHTCYLFVIYTNFNEKYILYLYEFESVSWHYDQLNEYNNVYCTHIKHSLFFIIYFILLA